MEPTFQKFSTDRSRPLSLQQSPRFGVGGQVISGDSSIWLRVRGEYFALSWRVSD